MNSQPEEDLQQRLERLEAEINSRSGETETRKDTKQQLQSNLLQLKLYSTRLQLWFKNLPGVGKLVVGGATVLISLSVLQAVLKLVTSVITLAVLGGLVYLGYKFFVSGSLSNKQ